MPLGNAAFSRQADVGQQFDPGGSKSFSNAGGAPFAFGPATARTTYGYRGIAGGFLPEGNAPIDVGATRQMLTARPGGGGKSPISGLEAASPTHARSIGIHNPLFWLLILGLLFVGYLGFVFDVEIPRMGGVRTHGGKE